MKKVFVLVIGLMLISQVIFAQSTSQQYKQEFVKVTSDTVVLLITDPKGNTVGGKIFTMTNLVQILNQAKTQYEDQVSLINKGINLLKDTKAPTLKKVK